MRITTQQDGLTLLVTLLLMGVLLGVSTSLLNVTLKQYQLSGIAYASEVAFQAANAGMECILYHDFPADEDASSPFEVSGTDDGRTRVPDLNCMGETSADEAVGSLSGEVISGEEQQFEFDLNSDLDGDSDLCVNVSVYKFYETTAFDGDAVGPDVIVDGVEMRDDPCPEGSECTVVQSRGYNVACNQIGTGARVVEREYTQVY